jgi:choline dehydrogenase-like flavoprotein
MLTRDLESEVRHLYVCDASVFPESVGMPTVLTIMGLAARLAARLVGEK